MEEEIASLKVLGRSSQEKGAGGDAERQQRQQPPLELIGDDMEEEEGGGVGGVSQCLEEMLDLKSYDKRLQPDDFIIDRAFQMVQKLFIHRFGKQIQAEELRRFTRKVSRYLSQVAYSLDGCLTDGILDCLLENLRIILPKKYLITLNCDDIRDLFNSIHALFNYEHATINYNELIAELYEQATMAVQERPDIGNVMQFKLVHLFKQLIEILPYKEFQKESTINSIVCLLLSEKPFDGRCISVENLVTDVVKYADENILYGVSVIPIRNLANNVYRRFMEKQQKVEKCNPKSKIRSSRNLVVSL